jgi:outer membrane protein TolC
MTIIPRHRETGAPEGIARRRCWRLSAPAALLIAPLSGCVSPELIRWQEPNGNETVRSPTLVPEPALAPAPAANTGSIRPGSMARAEPSRPERTNDPQMATAATTTDPKIPAVVTPPVVPPAPAEYPIDLTTALRLAEVENPEIAGARQLIREALALQQAAYALALPTLNAGTNFHGHTGNLQRSSGRILNLSEQSLYVGSGARTVAAESLAFPGVNIVSPLADVIFEPLVARQNVDRARFDATATTYMILLDVATLHFNLIQAEASLALWRESEADAAEVVRLTAAYARAGQGRKADADRAASNQRLIHIEVQHGEEEVAVASTRLARRLHLDPVVRIHTASPWVGPIALVDLSVPAEELVQVALQRRPEVAARAAAIGVAETRFHQERARPLLPTVWLGFSGGGFGGGSNLVPPFLGNFKGRTDFDVRAFWMLQNLGLGNLAIQKRHRAEIGAAVGQQSRTINQVRQEVTSARDEAIAARERIDATHKQLIAAQDGFREDLERIRGTVGLPIEVTNNLELLSDARQQHLRAILDFNRAQFRLFVSLGSPPPLDRPATEPLPPAPIAPPPLPLPPVAARDAPSAAPGVPSPAAPPPAIAGSTTDSSATTPARARR